MAKIVIIMNVHLNIPIIFLGRKSFVERGCGKLKKL